MHLCCFVDLLMVAVVGHMSWAWYQNAISMAARHNHLAIVMLDERGAQTRAHIDLLFCIEQQDKARCFIEGDAGECCHFVWVWCSAATASSGVLHQSIHAGVPIERVHVQPLPVRPHQAGCWVWQLHLPDLTLRRRTWNRRYDRDHFLYAPADERRHYNVTSSCVSQRLGAYRKWTLYDTQILIQGLS